jgi:hypothetical protein
MSKAKPTKYKLRLFQLRRLIFTTLQALLSGILALFISRRLQGSCFANITINPEVQRAQNELSQT